jgi:hypothetical protein
MFADPEAATASARFFSPGLPGYFRCTAGGGLDGEPRPWSTAEPWPRQLHRATDLQEGPGVPILVYLLWREGHPAAVAGVRAVYPGVAALGTVGMSRVELLSSTDAADVDDDDYNSLYLARDDLDSFAAAADRVMVSILAAGDELLPHDALGKLCGSLADDNAMRKLGIEATPSPTAGIDYLLRPRRQVRKPVKDSRVAEMAQELADKYIPTP